jgi:hypothetical protein
MKKNSQIHLKIETELLEKLKKEAQQNYISISEVCRNKLKKPDAMQEVLITLKSIERKVYSRE